MRLNSKFRGNVSVLKFSDKVRVTLKFRDTDENNLKIKKEKKK